MPATARTLLLATSNQRPMSSTIRALIRTVRNEVRDVISTYPWKPECKSGRSDSA